MTPSRSAGDGPGATWSGCPLCRHATAGVSWCPNCGFPQDGEEAARLRAILGRLDDTDAALRELSARRAGLLSEWSATLARPPVERRDATRPPRPRTVEWRADVVRDVLLWVGGVLLAVAALIFAAFAWNRLDDAGRAALLLGATVATGAGAAWLRPRLAATAEVLAALALTLVLVDWLALRRAGVGAGLDLALWWGVGTALTAVLAAATGRWLASPRPLMALAATASGALVVSAALEGWVAEAVGLAVLAGVLAAGGGFLGRSDGWTLSARLFGIGAVVVDLVALSALGIALDDGPSWAAVGATALLGAPCLAALATWRTLPDVGRGVVAGSAVAALMGSATVALWLAVTPPLLWAAVAGVAAAAMVAALTRESAEGLGGALTAGLVLASSALAVAGVVVTGVFGPLDGLDQVWTASVGAEALSSLPTPPDRDEATAAVLVAGVLALAAFAAVRRPQTRTVRPLCWCIAVLGGAGSLAVVPLAVAANVVAAMAITAAGAVAMSGAGVALSRRASPVMPMLGGGAVVLALPATGWALATRAGTLVFLSVALVTAVGAVAGTAHEVLRRAFGAVAVAAFVALAAAVVAAASGGGPWAGVAASVAAGIALVASSRWRRHHPEGVPGEVVAVIAAALATLAAAEDPLALAVALTLAVPPAAIAGARPDRSGYVGAAAVLAAAASWAWLGVADVVVVEAYSLAAAVAALAAGLLFRRRVPSTSSWLSLGPALLLAFGPSLVVGLADPGTLRPVLLTVAAVVAVALGARTRQQAPLTVGAVVLLVLAVDTMGPLAAAAPRWVTVGLAGAVLLWLGATFDRRLAQVRAARQRYELLESPIRAVGFEHGRQG